MRIYLCLFFFNFLDSYLFAVEFMMYNSLRVCTSFFVFVSLVVSMFFVPTVAHASGTDYRQELYSRVGMTVEEMNEWISDPNRNFAHHTESEVIDYLESNTKPGMVMLNEMEPYTVNAWSNQYFSRGLWITRSSVWSLELMATSWVMLPFPDKQIKSIEAWNTVKTRFSGDTQWRSYSWATQSMYDQFMCHFSYGFKNPWHLEPHRQAVGWNCN